MARHHPVGTVIAWWPAFPVSNNLIADPIREGSGIQVRSRFGSEAFTGHLWITNSTTVGRHVRAELELRPGAIWIYALEKSTTGLWLASWELPNSITCDDRPPVVPPPPPSSW